MLLLPPSFCFLYLVFSGCRSCPWFNRIPAFHPLWHTLKGITSLGLVRRRNLEPVLDVSPFTHSELRRSWRLETSLLGLSATDWYVLVSARALRNVVGASRSWLCSWKKLSDPSRVGILSISGSASGIINKLGWSANLSSELRSSLFSQRLLKYSICCCQEFGSRPPDLLASAGTSSWEVFSPGSLLIHFLVNKSLVAGALDCRPAGERRHALCPAALFGLMCWALRRGSTTNTVDQREGPIYYWPLFPGRREKHPPGWFGLVEAIR